MKRIDVHAHVGVWPFPGAAGDPVGRLLRLCDREGVEYAVCSSGLALYYDMEEGNAEMADAIAGHDRLLGYVYANANWLQRSVTEMERYLGSEGFVGVKIHPRFSAVPANSAHMAELIAAVAGYSRVLLMHTVDRNCVRQMGRYARQHRGLSIILAHAANTDSDEAAWVAREHPNVYLDFASEWPGAGRIERALDICGPEQIVYGTDMDLLAPGYARGMFEAAALTERQARLVYYENAARILGLAEQ
ncbi:MAG: amidohydrolase family protein [Armatimonadota bacterium]